jgi:hypothetical protein
VRLSETDGDEDDTQVSDGYLCSFHIFRGEYSAAQASKKPLAVSSKGL